MERKPDIMKITRKGAVISGLVLVLAIAAALAAGTWYLGLWPVTGSVPGSGLQDLLHPSQKNNIAPGTGTTSSSQTATPGSSGLKNPANPSIPVYPGESALQQQIEARHVAILQSITAGYEGRLNAQMSQASAEYQANAGSGRSHLLALAVKYLNKGQALEKESDNSFYPALNDFKSDLSSHSFSLNTANLAQQQYETNKAARKRAIFRAAANLI
jgi:hypothetical protein